MYCENCGNRIEMNSKFCEYCGKKIKKANAKVVSIEENTYRKKKFKKEIIAVAIVAVMVLAVFIGVWLHNSPEKRLAGQLNLGNRYLEEMDYEQAVVAFTKAIEIDPMNVDAYVGAAEAYVGLDDVDEAIIVLEKGYELTDDEEILRMLEKLRKSRKENSRIEEIDEVVEEKIEKYGQMKIPVYDIDSISVLGCNIWDEDWFEKVCETLNCPINEKKIEETGISLEDAPEGQFGFMNAVHNTDTAGTACVPYTLHIYNSPEEFYSIGISASDWDHTLIIKDSEADTSLFGNLSFKVGDTFESWYQLMNVEEIKALGMKSIQDYTDHTVLFYRYYNENPDVICEYLEYIYEDRDEDIYELQFTYSDNRKLYIRVTINDGKILEIEIIASSKF